MKIIRFFNDRVRKLTIFDIKLAQGAAMAVMLVIVKLLPPIMNVSIWWFVALAIILGLRPTYQFYIKS